MFVSYGQATYTTLIPMYSTILVPIDDDVAVDAVAHRAFEFARMYESSLHLLSVTDVGAEPPGLDRADRRDVRQTLAERSRQTIDRVHELAADWGLDATRAIREGTPHRVILEYAAEHDVDLLVIGTAGRTGPEAAGLGSTAERVLALADVPVLAVDSSDDVSAAESVGVDHVVVATDGSDTAERAAERGLDVAERYDAAVSVVYVVDSTTYELSDAPRSIVGLLKEGGQRAVEAIAEDARDRGLSVETSVLRGGPAAELASYREGLEGALVTMGTRGRGGASGELLGSTTARVLRRTGRPVLAVP